ncbi:MAG: InlB B-repeat-containing protein [Planctomycetia bacterium]
MPYQRTARDTKRVLAALVLTTCWWAWTANAQTAPVDVGQRLEPFVDRHLIETLTGATLRLHRPVDKGIVFRSDLPWEGNRCSRHSIVKDGDRFRCYYEAGHILTNAVNTPEFPYVTCFRTSVDGVTWEVPSLGVATFKGSKDNNVLVEDPQGKIQRLVPPTVSVNENPRAPADHKYIGLVHDFTPERIQFFISTSPDGITWTRQQKPFHEVPASDDGHIVYWDSNLGKYVAYLRIWYDPKTRAKGGWKIRDQGGVRWVERLVSADLTTWSAPELLTFNDAAGRPAPAEHIYQFNAEPYPRAAHLHLVIAPRNVIGRSVPSLADWDLGGRDKQITEGMLMTSRDGLAWDRTFMEPVYRPGRNLGNWAWKTMWPVRGLVQTDPEELSGYTYDNACWGTREMGNPQVRRWAWRLDGLASVTAGADLGEMITKPLVFAGRRLVLNYATAAAGSIRVEIQDGDGAPIPGYGLADCPDRFGDEIEGVVHWKNGPDLGPLVGKPVRLRFVLRDADLYSMRFANPGNLQYRVQYHANGATSGAAPAAQTKEHDVALTLALSGKGIGEATFLKKTGFVFAGWNTAADGSGTTYAEWGRYAVNEPLTLYAKWMPIPKPHAVAFDRNGATSGWGPAALAKAADLPLKLPSGLSLAKPGCVFAGWNTAADGSGTTYAAGDTYVADADITLYALWKPAGGNRPQESQPTAAGASAARPSP